MSDKKNLEINIDELDKVTGGAASSEYLPADHGRWVGKYHTEAYIGRILYFVLDNCPWYYFIGRLTRSWEYENHSFSTKRVYDINVLWVSDELIDVYCYTESSYREMDVIPGRSLHRASSDVITAFEYNGTQYS